MLINLKEVSAAQCLPMLPWPYHVFRQSMFYFLLFLILSFSLEILCVLVSYWLAWGESLVKYKTFGKSNNIAVRSVLFLDMLLKKTVISFKEALALNKFFSFKEVSEVCDDVAFLINFSSDCYWSR